MGIEADNDGESDATAWAEIPGRVRRLQAGPRWGRDGDAEPSWCQGAV